MNTRKDNFIPGRRRFVQGAAAAGLLAGLEALVPGYALSRAAASSGLRPGADGIVDLTIARKRLRIGGANAKPVTINGTVPGPLLRLREGQTANIRVTNLLDEDTSIHWHGIILPYQMDGVPGVSFRGIRPGETFTYRFDIRQSGTYWYHSHSGLQEQLGHYGGLVIDPATPEPYAYDRDYVVLLSDWTFEDPHDVYRRLKVAEGYYNYQQRTVGDFFDDVSRDGFARAVSGRSMWGRMRMSPRDIADVTGSTYTFLMNGVAPDANWTGLFRPGERVRLRFINGSAMSYFDVRIPGLKMTVVQADGQDVQPVPVDEFRIGVAETYDVIVEPDREEAYTIFAESMDRSGFARGTLATREGLVAEVPAQRKLRDRGMGAMGMSMEGGHGGMQMDGMAEGPGEAAMTDQQSSPGMDHSRHGGSGVGMKSEQAAGMNGDAPRAGMAMGAVAGGTMTHGPDHHGPGAAMVAMNPRSRLHEPGAGLEDAGRRVLVYTDLRSRAPWPDARPPERELTLHLTGNMERYMWSFDGLKFSEVEGPVQFRHGERLRLTLVNDTMMDHPIHLHGMWMELNNGAGEHKPRKHTISLKPGEVVSADITVDAPGDWAFHCHLLYHMKAGMFRVVSVA